MIETEKQLLPATSDCIFKALMLDEELRDYLRYLIYFITEIPLEELQNITVQNVEYPINNKKNRQMRSDIVVSINKHIINLEMNKKYYDGLFKRNDGYLFKIGSNLYNKKEDYTDVKKIIQINFDNFSYFKENKEIYKFVYKEEGLDIELEETPIKYHIDLAFIRKTCYNKDVLLLSKFERYMLFLIAETDKFAKKLVGDDDILKKVSEKLSYLSEDEDMIGLYDAELEAEKIMRTRLKYAEKIGTEKGLEKGFKKGIKKGLDQGIQQGLDQGIQQGIQQGIEHGIEQGQAKEKLNIAKNMLNEKIDVAIVSKVTGLSIKQINKLIN